MTEEDIYEYAMDFISYYRNKGYSDKWISNRFNIFLNQVLFEENMYQYVPINNYKTRKIRKEKQSYE